MLQSVLNNILAAAPAFFDPWNLMLLVVGVFFGLIAGALPGFSTSMALALLLPFSFGIGPINGLSLMIGTLVGGVSGGLVTSIVLGIPGSASSVPSTLDGYALTRKGQSSYALGLAIWASFFGGILSWMVLVALAPTLATVGLEFGPWDFFALMAFALTIAASLAGEDLLKGLMAAAGGVVLAQVGADPITSVNRLNYGNSFLAEGFDPLTILIGLFAFSQLLSDMQDRRSATRSMSHGQEVRLEPVQNRRSLLAIARHWKTVIWSSALGIFIGIVPAVGSNVSSLIAYDQARRNSSRPQRFGKGEPTGVIAPEACNNADVGGSLTVLMSLGIPGDTVSVMLLAALTLHNVAPGPTFIAKHPDISYTIYIAYLAATFVVLAMQIYMLRIFMLIRWIPFYRLNATLLICCALGVFAWSGVTNDLWVVVMFGVLGYCMRLAGFPLAPFVLGVVLSAPTELNLVRALSSSDDLSLFVTRPWAMLFMILVVFTLAFPLYNKHRAESRAWRLYYPLMSMACAVPWFLMGGWLRSTIGAVLAVMGAYCAYKALSESRPDLGRGRSGAESVALSKPGLSGGLD
jgi:putative tricarboxylic transport membrane protein